ncbi:MAG: hypothetical protein NUV91_07210, partial [Candidatus Omnitrophica bacterium]|nr:hypothetical protein [Candidatus Omnitrophota bacterium]
MFKLKKFRNQTVSILIVGIFLINNPCYAQEAGGNAVRVEVPADAVTVTRIIDPTTNAIVEGTYREDIFPNEVTMTVQIGNQTWNVQGNRGSYLIPLNRSLSSGQRVVVNVRGIGADG